jgi:hypothetical protein
LVRLTAVGKDELIHHALQGVRGCLQGDQELTASNVTIAVVGVDQPFKIIEGAELQPYVRKYSRAGVGGRGSDVGVAVYYRLTPSRCLT